MTARLKVAILDDYSRLCVKLHHLLSRSIPTVMPRNISHSRMGQQIR
jgi:hypothetical protein